MSRVISDILNAPEPHFSHAIKNWEQASGKKGHDIRLVSEISRARLNALKTLNLDQADTTSRELFFALRHRATHTNDELEKVLSVTPTDTPTELINKIITFIDGLTINRDVWVVKHAVIKQILLKHCPKKTLKVLGLRSIDSVLKRTSATEILALAYQLESPEWVVKLHAHHKKFKPTDFQVTRSQIFAVNETRALKLQKGGYSSPRIIVPNYETGTVMIVPPAKRFTLDTLALTLAILQTLYELRVYSAYFRLNSVKDNFGTRVHSILHDGLGGSIQETEIGWKVLQRYFNQKPESFAAIEQPHLQQEDIALRTPFDVLIEHIPSIEFWRDHAHVYMFDGDRPVSLHVLDVVTNASNNLPYENSVHLHLSQQLWEELGLRYLDDEKIHTHVAQKYIEDTQPYL